MQIACPSCKKSLRIADSAAGKKVKCPACQTMFTAVDTVEEVVQAGPPPRKPKAPEIVDDIEEVPQARPRRGRDDDDDEDRPRRPRGRDDDDDDRPRRPRSRDDEDDDDRPRRGKRRYEEDDDGDDDRGSKNEARRRAGGAAIWFLLAGIVTAIIVVFGVVSALFLSANIGPMVNQPGYQAGRIAGIIGCGVVGALGCVFQFLASSSIKSFRNKGVIITAIVFEFIFGLLFGIGLVLSILGMAAGAGLLPGGLMALLVAEILLRGAGTFLNLFAAIKGIVTLNNRAVSRRFGR